MENLKAGEKPQEYSVLTFTWGKYKDFAFTSREKKRHITWLRIYVIVFGLAGAVFGLLCQLAGHSIDCCQVHQFSYACYTLRWLYSGICFGFISANCIPKIFGVLSAFSIGLSMYFSMEVLKNDEAQSWIRTRSAAEFLKSESYKFATGIPPYNIDEDKTEILMDKTEKMIHTVEDIPCKILPEDKKSDKIPTPNLTVDQYIDVRVNDQINDYYQKNVNDYIRKINSAKNWSAIVSIFGIFLGALGFTGWTAGWVALSTTITASISGYIYANRFQYLIISYQSTSNRLEVLKNKWYACEKTDKQRYQFIMDCEEAISIENGSWMAELKNSPKVKING